MTEEEDVRGSRKRDNMRALGRDPRDAQLRDGDSLALRHRFQRLHDGEVGLEVLVLEAGVSGTDVAVCGLWVQ
jgi:hypothetical protein